MSWDVALVRTKTNTEPIEEVNNTNRKCFCLDAVVDTLEKNLGRIEKSDLTWLDYETCDYSVSFQLDPEEIILHIHILSDSGESAVLTLVKSLCIWLNCRAINRTENDFIK